MRDVRYIIRYVIRRAVYDVIRPWLPELLRAAGVAGFFFLWVVAMWLIFSK